MKLSEVIFENIRPGLTEVISATGLSGKVDQKYLNPGDRFDERYVHILWSDGHETENWLCWMDKIEVASL